MKINYKRLSSGISCVLILGICQTKAGERKTHDSQDNFGFLAGTWNTRRIVHYDHVGMGNGPFDHTNFHADIAIKNNQIVINIVNDGPRPAGYNGLEDTFIGTINGNDLDSIQWAHRSLNGPPLSGTEVVISAGHKRILIYAPLTYNGRVDPHGQEWLLSR